MSFIVKGFPEIYLMDFPVDRWSQYTCTLKHPMNSLPEDEEQLFGVLAKTFLKEKRLWDSENRGEKRILKVVPKITHSIKCEAGTGIMSFISHTYSKRGKQITTKVVEDTLTPEQMDSPANADYNLEYVDHEASFYLEGKSVDLITEGIDCDTIFAVEHKNRQDEPTVPCNACHGSGVQKCQQCNGTGRESYVDGYYASGEERIKTGNCSECGGSGRVPCPECNGKGEIQIYARQYSLVRSVKDTVSKRASMWFYLPGDSHPSPCIDSPDELEHKEFDSSIEGTIDRSYLTQAHDVFKLIRKTGEFTYIKKNNQTFIEDNRKEVESLMEEIGISEKYHAINERESKTAPSKSQRGEEVSRQEVNNVFPTKQLTVSYGKYNTLKFLLYDVKGMATVKVIGLYDMSFGEALKYKLLSLFKK